MYICAAGSSELVKVSATLIRSAIGVAAHTSRNSRGMFLKMAIELENFLRKFDAIAPNLELAVK
jgi:hypothetical protein